MRHRSRPPRPHAALPTLPALLLVALQAAAAPAAAQQPGAAAAIAQAAERPAERSFTVIHTSDIHSALLPTPFVDLGSDAAGVTRGGFARLAAAVEAVRARKGAVGEPVLLTSAGDHLGGTPFAWLALAAEAPELELMLELGYDVLTLGNHEFDYGPERLAMYLQAAGYPDAAARTPVVASNTRAPAGHPLEAMGLRRTHVVTLANGLRVGFLGLLGTGAQRYAPGAAPVAFDDPETAAAEAVESLREAGVDVVVALTHSGLAEDRALARAVPGIDVILGGHDHRLLDLPAREGSTLIVHPGARLEQIVVLELAYDPATGTVRIRNEPGEAADGRRLEEPYVVPLNPGVGESGWMAARVADHRARLEARIAAWTGGRFDPLDATAARSGSVLAVGGPRAEWPLGNFVTDAMRAAVEAATGERVDFAFQANGVIRGSVVPGSGAARRGEITLYDLAAPVGMGAGPDGEPGYPLVAVWLTGEEVRRALEVSILLSQLLGDSFYLQASGLRATYAPRRAVLARIPFRGTPIPSGRAVLSVERERRAVAAVDDHLPLERGDTALYRVVTDRYVASFLPMVGELVASLAIQPKDRHGAPLSDIDEAIVRHEGRELKVWQAVLEYAAAQPADATGPPRIDAAYGRTAGRLVEVEAAPLWALPAGVGVLLVVGVLGVWAARRRTNRGQAT